MRGSGEIFSVDVFTSLRKGQGSYVHHFTRLLSKSRAARFPSPSRRGEQRGEERRHVEKCARFYVTRDQESAPNRSAAFGLPAIRNGAHLKAENHLLPSDEGILVHYQDFITRPGPV